MTQIWFDLFEWVPRVQVKEGKVAIILWLLRDIVQKSTIFEITLLLFRLFCLVFAFAIVNTHAEATIEHIHKE